ncbi:hypothetical protein F5Y15DRAFT_82322 [Xylariaceae sp. FL0016]|nr:hypothetical protein F5Y15DRAFT_82322 [Xylariaceae sp. FL0016]
MDEIGSIGTSLMQVPFSCALLLHCLAVWLSTYVTAFSYLRLHPLPHRFTYLVHFGHSDPSVPLTTAIPVLCQLLASMSLT